MKKLNIKIDLSKYNLKDNLLLIIIFSDIAIITWIFLELVNISIFTIIVLTAVLNIIIIYYISNKSKKKNNEINKSETK